MFYTEYLIKLFGEENLPLATLLLILFLFFILSIALYISNKNDKANDYTERK